MGNVTMHAKDALSAGLAECYATINGNRYKLMNAKSLEAKFEKTKVEVAILGKTGMGNKSTGWKGTGSATFYFNQSMFRQLLLDYKNGDGDIYFDIQITNEDETSTVGKQTIVLIDCNIDGGILAKFESGEGILEEDMSFTFDDFEMPETFTMLNGML